MVPNTIKIEQTLNLMPHQYKNQIIVRCFLTPNSVLGKHHEGSNDHSKLKKSERLIGFEDSITMVRQKHLLTCDQRKLMNLSVYFMSISCIFRI